MDWKFDFVTSARSRERAWRRMSLESAWPALVAVPVARPQDSEPGLMDGLQGLAARGALAAGIPDSPGT